MPTDNFKESNRRAARARAVTSSIKRRKTSPLIKLSRHGDSEGSVTVNERSAATRRLQRVKVTLPELPPFKEEP